MGYGDPREHALTNWKSVVLRKFAQNEHRAHQMPQTQVDTHSPSTSVHSRMAVLTHQSAADLAAPCDFNVL